MNLDSHRVSDHDPPTQAFQLTLPPTQLVVIDAPPTGPISVPSVALSERETEPSPILLNGTLEWKIPGAGAVIDCVDPPIVTFTVAVALSDTKAVKKRASIEHCCGGRIV
jgi:hypothetical protein